MYFPSLGMSKYPFRVMTVPFFLPENSLQENFAPHSFISTVGSILPGGLDFGSLHMRLS